MSGVPTPAAGEMPQSVAQVVVVVDRVSTQSTLEVLLMHEHQWTESTSARHRGPLRGTQAQA